MPSGQDARVLVCSCRAGTFLSVTVRRAGNRDPEEDQLTRAFLTQLRLCPAAHMAFLDLIRERQPECNPLRVSPSDLLGNPVEIATQECHLRRDGGRLLSVVLTREPWSTVRSVVPTPERRRYDGVVYYGDEAVMIIENKPRENKDDLKKISEVLEHEMCPNLSEGADFQIDPGPVNILWPAILERLMRLADADALQRTEVLALRDFQELVQAKFPDLFPYSSVRSCNRAVGPLRERCGAILKRIAPDSTKRDGIRDYYIDLDAGAAKKTYFGPDPADDGRTIPVEQIRLQMYPALMTTQAQRFYSDPGVKPELFLNLSDRWEMAPYLAFRVRGSLPRLEAKIIADPGKYFSFWRENPSWIRGNMPKEFAADEWWTKLVQDGIVREGQRATLLSAFTPKELINACPGWQLSFSWDIEEAERLDGRRSGSSSTGTEFVPAAREKIVEAFRAMGQDFDELTKVTAA